MKPFRTAFTFDDNAELLEKYRVRGVFFLRTQDASEELATKLSLNHEVASHTCTHPHLTKLDDSAAFEEIIRSKTELERMIRRKVISFAYPFGELDARI